MKSAQDLNRTELTNVGDYTKHIRFARVVKVYDASTVLAENKKYGLVDLVWVDTNDKVNGSVDFLKTGYSSNFGYGIIVMPSVGDIAACYTLSASTPIVLGFISRNQWRALIADKDNASDIAHMPALKSGEIFIKGASQSTIHLQKDGLIKIVAKDGTNTTAVPNNNSQYGSDKFFDKASDSNDNTVIEMELGNSDKAAGPAKQIFSLTSGEISTQTYVLQAAPKVLQYSLNSETQIEIGGIESVKLYSKGTDGKRVLKKTLGPNSKVGLVKSYYYTQGLVDQNDSSKNTCTLDSNGIITSITLPPDVAGLLTNNTTIEVTVSIKRNDFSFKVNKLGDALIDCRNFVVRTKENKSCFGLFEDSRSVLSAVTNEIGNKLTGYIRTDRGGVHTSAGTFQTAKLENVEAENSKDITGETLYFYILDELPLIAYTPDNKSAPYHFVSATEYTALNAIDRTRITCKPFDSDFTQDGFNREKLTTLLEAANNNKEKWLSYGQLRLL